MVTVRLGAQWARRGLLVASLVLLLALAGAAGAVGSQLVVKTAAAAPPLFDEDAVAALYERTVPAVVKVDVVQRPATDGFGRFRLPTGQGSGFLIDAENGYILTNYHVVQGASQVQIIFSDGRTANAQVAGSSPADDLALLKVEPSEVEGIWPLRLGDSNAVRPGQLAIALGSPFGLEESITVGVVSGVNRTRPGASGRSITGMVQTDAQLNPGNSGGPLLNSRGEVIGINTSVEPSGGGSGIGFAVSINTVKAILPQLQQGSTVERPFLGIRGATVTPALVQQLGLSTSQGAYIAGVQPGSPAETAGLRGGEIGAGEVVGDVIIALDDQPVRSVTDLINYLNGHHPGDTVRLTIDRGGETQEVTVVLQSWPERR